MDVTLEKLRNKSTGEVRIELKIEVQDEESLDLVKALFDHGRVVLALRDAGLEDHEDAKMFLEETCPAIRRTTLQPVPDAGMEVPQKQKREQGLATLLSSTAVLRKHLRDRDFVSFRTELANTRNALRNFPGTPEEKMKLGIVLDIIEQVSFDKPQA
jgi:hypothetical protein